MREKAFKADGAAGSGGMKPGDLIAGVTTKGRGGKPVFNATPKTVWFLASVGPPNGVFEGSSVTVHVIRNEAAQQDFVTRSSSIKISSRTDKDVPQYKEVLDSVESIACNVTMQAESEGAKRTRVKKLTARKKELNIEKMDIDLVNNFMYAECPGVFSPRFLPLPPPPLPFVRKTRPHKQVGPRQGA